MNIIDLLTGIIPISSALLSVVAAITASMLTKKIKKRKDDIHEITIKLNDKKIKVDGYSEDEIVEIISKAIEKGKSQSESVEKKEKNNLLKNGSSYQKPK